MVNWGVRREFQGKPSHPSPGSWKVLRSSLLQIQNSGDAGPLGFRHKCCTADPDHCGQAVAWVGRSPKIFVLRIPSDRAREREWCRNWTWTRIIYYCFLAMAIGYLYILIPRIRSWGSLPIAWILIREFFSPRAPSWIQKIRWSWTRYIWVVVLQALLLSGTALYTLIQRSSEFRFRPALHVDLEITTIGWFRYIHCPIIIIIVQDLQSINIEHNN